jgi:AcrR family transcriptional regulator
VSRGCKVCDPAPSMKRRPPPTSGRKSQARSNDRRILDAAREVFLANPEAPVSLVARRAAVGIGSLYRRYRSKNALLGRICLEGLQRYIAEAEAALADPGEPWAVYVAFMRRIVDADTHSYVLRFAGAFRPSKALYREAARAQALNLELFDRTKATGVFRAGIEATDIAVLFEQLAAIRLGDSRRTAQLRSRYLALIVESLGARAAAALPGPVPTWDEINSRWK